MAYEIPNREGRDEFIRLVTTIMEPAEASGAELAAVYHERWEEESVFDEIETHLRGRINRRVAVETYRNRPPGIWALLLTHYAIRHLMTEVAEQADIDGISFARSSRAVRRQVSNQAAFSPETLRQTTQETISEILERPNLPRRYRSCPRAVKKAQSR